MNSSYGISPTADKPPRLPQSDRVNTLVPWPTTLSTSLRLKFFLTGVVFPVICLGAILFGASPSIGNPWQSGNLEDFVLVLVRPPAILVVFPLMMYSFVCLSAWCYRPEKSNRFAIWLGLVTGAVLACMFMVLLIPSTAFFGQVMAGFVAGALAIVFFAAKYLIRKRFSIRYLLIVTTVVAAICAVIPLLLIEPTDILGFLVYCLFFVIGGAPTLGMITFTRVSFAASRVERKQRQIESTINSRNLPKIAGAWIVWLGAFAASWKLAIDLMLIEYAKLPTNPPNCYVCSAAANGHRRLVKSKPIEVGPVGGREWVVETRSSVPVNLQMKRLKFLEFAMATLCPRIHQTIRIVYNNIGPTLARACDANVWFSDLTYLALKPLECLAIVIRIAIGVSKQKVSQIYRSRDLD